MVAPIAEGFGVVRDHEDVISPTIVIVQGRKGVVKIWRKGRIYATSSEQHVPVSFFKTGFEPAEGHEPARAVVLGHSLLILLPTRPARIRISDGHKVKK